MEDLEGVVKISGEVVAKTASSCRKFDIKLFSSGWKGYEERVRTFRMTVCSGTW